MGIFPFKRENSHTLNCTYIYREMTGDTMWCRTYSTKTTCSNTCLLSLLTCSTPPTPPPQSWGGGLEWVVSCPPPLPCPQLALMSLPMVKLHCFQRRRKIWWGARWGWVDRFRLGIRYIKKKFQCGSMLFVHVSVMWYFFITIAKYIHKFLWFSSKSCGLR